MISVIIPAYNRAPTLRRAIESVLRQTVQELEVIVVDDASTDASAEIACGVEDPRVRCITHPSNRGGAVARNTGIMAAAGDYIAFLDSDDEWLPEHLADSLAFLQEHAADGVFGSFFLVEREGRVATCLCKDRSEKLSMAEYIWSGDRKGDARTSTFVFRRDAIRAILFDPELRKHQDWDLAIRFAERFRLLSRARPTVMIHHDAGNRMSAKVNHEATRRLLARHLDRLSDPTRAKIYTYLAYRTFQEEGRSPQFRAYVGQALGGFRAARPIDRIAMVALRVPWVDRFYAGSRELFFKSPLLVRFYQAIHKVR
jgi:glycosyltransferase involved in cell wall biosynthesis